MNTKTDELRALQDSVIQAAFDRWRKTEYPYAHPIQDLPAFHAGYLAALARQEEGREAVAWQVRFVMSDVGYWSGWAQAQSEDDARHMVERYAALGRQAEWRALYTTPHPPSGGDGDASRDRLWDAILGELNLAYARGQSGEPAGSMDAADRIRRLATLAPHSGGEGDALLTECYMAMQAAMNVIDVNEGPGLEHSRVVNALADCRIKIEQRNASRRLAAPTPQASADGVDGLHPNVSWRDLGDWYNTLYHGAMYLNERDYGHAGQALDDVIEKLEALRNAHGNHASFKSLADKEAAALTAKPTTAGQQAAGVSEEMVSAVRFAPTSAYWSEKLVEFFGPAARSGIDALDARIRELTAAGAAPEGWPARYACNGPEGTFWTDDAVLANRLLLHDTAIERDEWTVTDTQQPGAQHGQEGR